MPDAQLGAELVELVFACGRALAQAEQAIGGLPAPPIVSRTNGVPRARSDRMVRIRIGQARSRSREASGARWLRSWP